jgi:hypothetical protein
MMLTTPRKSRVTPLRILINVTSHLLVFVAPFFVGHAINYSSGV